LATGHDGVIIGDYRTDPWGIFGAKWLAIRQLHHNGCSSLEHPFTRLTTLATRGFPSAVCFPATWGGHKVPADRESVTRLLREWNSGNKTALDELMPVVYDQLHRLASNCLRSERPDHTLRATALVNEAYLRLVNVDVEWQDRVHFFALAARMLRRILVDHAKTNRRDKRGGGAEKVELDEAVMIGPQAGSGIIELDLALQRLAEEDPRKSEIIELLCFGGLTYDETAVALKISPATVHRELKIAKAFLHRELMQRSS
jgi:RNA polymerase sigma factor (TIGR02999 family)